MGRENIEASGYKVDSPILRDHVMRLYTAPPARPASQSEAGESRGC